VTPVQLARLVDRALRLLRLGHLGANLVGRDLGLRQRVDQLLIVQDVALRVGQHEQDLVLDLLELLLHLGVVHHQLGLEVGEVGALLRHHRAQQLLLQALHGDEEVEE